MEIPLALEDQMEILAKEIKTFIPSPVISGIESADRIILDDGIEGLIAKAVPIIKKVRVRKGIVFVSILLLLGSFGGPFAILIIITLVIMRFFRKRKRK